ncbi:MAG TPA: LutB/LldF family L-lactate oxidation iron-sulfur protein [Fimbriimonadaceae bacterium]|nr:LutB/LldF family L-lactate oxidation iron-sulfur protein [Fimbriimonadaceae bacterium]
MKVPPVEEFARQLAPDTVGSVRKATANLTTARTRALGAAFEDVADARVRAAAIKNYVLDNLKSLLIQLEAACQKNGIQVHWAQDAEAARQIALEICKKKAPQGSLIAKAKSMVTEEIHLNGFLEEHGYKPVETDLGEYIVQLDHDTPSHIVTPIIHKNRRQVSETFAKEGLGPRTDDPTVLAMQARERLRTYFRQAKIGVSGVNFAIAETGRLVLIENEGNSRFSTTAPEIHIAFMGIEKMLPREADLPLFLRLLAGSATGQQLTSYVHLISGPRKEERDGPTEVHLILLDNGRSRVLNGKYREILRCIRCGACLNVCPVYRQASGHAYGHVYSGPVGSVLSPAMEGVDKAGWMAKASSLCGACEEVCPVRIPIPRMLLQIRDEAVSSGAIKEPAPWGLYAKGASRGWPWRVGLKLLPMASRFHHPLKDAWTASRALPRRTGRDFRSWWNDRP